MDTNKYLRQDTFTNDLFLEYPVRNIISELHYNYYIKLHQLDDLYESPNTKKEEKDKIMQNIILLKNKIRHLETVYEFIIEEHKQEQIRTYDNSKKLPIPEKPVKLDDLTVNYAMENRKRKNKNN